MMLMQLLIALVRLIAITIAGVVQVIAMMVATNIVEVPVNRKKKLYTFRL
jgi:hypothetical protein